MDVGIDDLLASLKGSMGGSLGGTDTSLTVAGGFVGQTHLSKVAADHVKLDFNVVKGLSVVNSDIGAHHLGEDDCVAKVCLDRDGLLTSRTVLLCLLDLGIHSEVAVLDFCINN